MWRFAGTQVGERDLERVDHGAEAIVLDAAGEGSAHELTEGVLDGGPVIERGNVARRHTASLALVEVAQVLTAQGRGAAADAVVFYVLALGDGGENGHGGVAYLVFLCIENKDFKGDIRGENLEGKGVTGTVFDSGLLICLLIITDTK